MNIKLNKLFKQIVMANHKIDTETDLKIQKIIPKLVWDAIGHS